MMASTNTRGRGLRTLGRAAGLTAAILAASALFAGPAAMASITAKATVYNNIPSPLPGNVPSIGFEANGASEYGGQVSFAGTNRTNPVLNVVMSSWGCQSGTWNAGNCATAKKAKFTAPLTFNVYTVGAGDEPGTLIGTVTHSFNMPYRPSANYTKCNGADDGKWYDKSDATCYNGMAFTVTVKLGSLDLPDNAIISVAYNTTHYGYNPIGEGAPCFSTSAGCAYDALNVGTGDSPASVGSQPLPDDAYWNATQPSQYCDGGAGGTDTFRLDQADGSCNWTGYQPAFKVKASA